MSKGLLNCNIIWEIRPTFLRQLRETVSPNVENEVGWNVRIPVRLQMIDRVREPLHQWIREQWRKDAYKTKSK